MRSDKNVQPTLHTNFGVQIADYVGYVMLEVATTDHGAAAEEMHRLQSVLRGGISGLYYVCVPDS